MKNFKKKNEIIPFEYPRSFLENIVVNSPVGIIMTDYDFTIKYMNAIALDVHKIKQEAYFNKDIKLTDYIIEPEKIINMKEPLISEKENNICITYEIQHNNDRRTIRVKVNLARDEYYNPVGGFFYICEDVTEVKELREKAHEIEKYETLHNMIVTYNHEINNIISVIMGRIELLLRRSSPQDKNYKSIDEIYNSTKKLSEIVKKIREIKKVKTKDYVNGIKMIDINNI